MCMSENYNSKVKYGLLMWQKSLFNTHKKKKIH